MLRDLENKNLVVRLAYEFMGFDDRAMIPQVLQAIFTKSFLSEDDIPIKIEILPYAGRDVADDEFATLLQEFQVEAHKANLLVDPAKTDDLGVFEYTDPKTRQPKKVLMAVDGSTFPEGNNKCTNNYPSLAIQQARQQELLDNDGRLKILLPNGLTELPKTTIIQNTAREDRSPGS